MLISYYYKITKYICDFSSLKESVLKSQDFISDFWERGDSVQKEGGWSMVASNLLILEFNILLLHYISGFNKTA